MSFFANFCTHLCLLFAEMCFGQAKQQFTTSVHMYSCKAVVLHCTTTWCQHGLSRVFLDIGEGELRRYIELLPQLKTGQAMTTQQSFPRNLANQHYELICLGRRHS